MNSELENLIELSMVDGYINDKELRVLRKKAEKLGFDLEELEIVLEARLYKNNISTKPELNRCPSCGEILSGEPSNCPSCDYILKIINPDDPKIEEEINELTLSNNNIQALPKPSFLTAFKDIFLIIISLGLYAVYKRSKNIPFFDKSGTLIVIQNDTFDYKTQSLLKKYTESEKIKYRIYYEVKEHNTLLEKRSKTKTINACVACFIFACFGYLISRINFSEGIQQSKFISTVDSLIIAKQPFNAERMLPKVKSNYEKEKLAKKIIILKIDSLSDAGNYTEALKIANMLNSIYPGHESDRETNIDKIVEKEVNRLIAAKEFEKARERAKLARYRSALNEKIDLAEELNE